MKLGRIGAVSAVFLSVLILGGCSEDKKAPEPENAVTSSDVGKEVGEAEKKPGTYTQDRHQDYYLKVTEQLNQIEAKIDELKKDLAGQSDEVKSTFQERVERLEKRESAAREQLKQLMNTATEASWHALEKGMQEALDELEKSHKELAAELSSTAPRNGSKRLNPWRMASRGPRA